MRPQRQRRHGRVSTMLTDAQVERLERSIIGPRAAEEIDTLRKRETDLDRRATKVQYRDNRLAWLYPVARIKVGELVEGCGFKALHPTKGWQRGRDGVIPSKATLNDPGWVEFVIAPHVADQLIRRDLGAAIVAEAARP